MIIDANNLILGRLASFVAKQALLGEKIDIINSGEAVIVGDKKVIFERYMQRKKRGSPHHGPFFPMRADRILHRTIRNMLPHRAYRGKTALRNIRCYLNAPESINKNEAKTVKTAMLKSTALKYIKLKDLVRLLTQK